MLRADETKQGVKGDPDTASLAKASNLGRAQQFDTAREFRSAVVAIDKKKKLDHNFCNPREIISYCLTPPQLKRVGGLSSSLSGFTVTDQDVVFFELVITSIEHVVQWTLFKRFSEFYALYESCEEALGTRAAHLLPPPPDKAISLLTDHLDEEFISQRRVLLQHFVRKLLAIPLLLTTGSPLLSFLLPSEADTVQQVNQEFDVVLTERDLKDPDCKLPSPGNKDAQPRSIARISSQPRSKHTFYESEEVTAVSIVSSTILKGDHVVYQIHAYNKHQRKSYAHWTALRRYVEFSSLDERVRATLESRNPHFRTDLLPQLPEKEWKLLVDHLDKDFIEKRRLLLQLYLRKMIHIEEVVEMDVFQKFINL
jgi:hypothetical protein